MRSLILFLMAFFAVFNAFAAPLENPGFRTILYQQDTVWYWFEAQDGDTLWDEQADRFHYHMVNGKVKQLREQVSTSGTEKDRSRLENQLTFLLSRTQVWEVYLPDDTLSVRFFAIKNRVDSSGFRKADAVFQSEFAYQLLLCSRVLPEHQEHYREAAFECLSGPCFGEG